MRIYNSLTKKKELLFPKLNFFKIYVCGVTPYDECHIGHARTYVFFDALIRYLTHRGYKVMYVRNITDIDDKIIKRANENEEEISALVLRNKKLMDEQFKVLGILPPDKEPRVTENMPAIIDCIKTLVDKGFAYKSVSGDVYYRVKKFKNYGCFSGQNLKELKSGNRVEINDDKESPLDFVLWKQSKPKEPFWDSPWGPGRPGWHIECSAMSLKDLGHEIDIHGGGFDLRFPHHENEIAQTEAITDCACARYWVHAGMVKVNSEKMSKSLGNFFTISEVLKKYDPQTLRYFLLSSKYRSDLNYSEENLEHARASLNRLKSGIDGIICDPIAFENESQAGIQFVVSDIKRKFYFALEDDFNTPLALSHLFEMLKRIKNLKKMNLHNQAYVLFWHLKQLIGILGINI